MIIRSELWTKPLLQRLPVQFVQTLSCRVGHRGCVRLRFTGEGGGLRGAARCDHAGPSLQVKGPQKDRWGVKVKGRFGSTSGWIRGLKTGEPRRNLDHLLFPRIRKLWRCFQTEKQARWHLQGASPWALSWAALTELKYWSASGTAGREDSSLWKRGQVILHNQCIELFGFHFCQFSTESKTIIDLLMHRFWNKLFTVRSNYGVYGVYM